MSKATDTQWRVQVRKSRNHAWKNKGLFETRSAAREDAVEMREWDYCAGQGWHGYGFGNTRVVKYQKK